jgi:hypothetical protein
MKRNLKKEMKKYTTFIEMLFCNKILLIHKNTTKILTEKKIKKLTTSMLALGLLCIFE